MLRKLNKYKIFVPLTFFGNSLRITVDYSFFVKKKVKNRKSAVTGNSTDGKIYRERMYMMTCMLRHPCLEHLEPALEPRAKSMA